MKTLLVLLAVCAFASAFKVLVHKTEQQVKPRTEASTTASICTHSMPCAWSYYRESKRIEMNITNIYCVCSADTSCKVTEDDTSNNVYVLHCRPA